MSDESVETPEVDNSKPSMTKETYKMEEPAETTPLNNIDEDEETLPKYSKPEKTNVIQPRPSNMFGEYGQ